MKAVILLGGEESCTRFRPISFNRVKPLFPIAGLPMVQHHLESLKATGQVTEVLLIGFYKENQINDFISSISSEYTFKVKYLRDSSQLGSAGSLFFFRDQILEGSSKNFIVINVDVVTDVDLKDMITMADNKLAQDPEMAGLLLGVNPNNAESPDSVGYLRKDENDKLTNYIEKPEKVDKNLAQYVNGGVYVFTLNLFKNIGEHFVSMQQRRSSKITSLSFMRQGEPRTQRYTSFSVDANAHISLENQIFPRTTPKNFPLYVHAHAGHWSQLKAPTQSLKANEIYLQMMANKGKAYQNYALATGDNIIGNVYVAENASISPDAKLGPNVVIGKNTIVKGGARIKNSIILDNCVCNQNSLVINSVVGWKSQIGLWARVQGTLDQQHSKLFVGGKMSFTITSLGEGVNVANEVLVRDSIVLPHMSLVANCVNEVRL